MVEDKAVEFSWGQSSLRVPTVGDLNSLDINKSTVDEVSKVMDKLQKSGSNKGAMKDIIPSLPKIAPQLIKAAIPLILTNPPDNVDEVNLFDIIKVVKLVKEDKRYSDFLEAW